MTIIWSRVMPVLISIVILITVAILRQYSKTFAAIAATMPINIPLALWIAASGDTNADSNVKQAALTDFSGAVALNLIPTLIFAIVVWQLTRAGSTMLPAIVIGYVAWAVCLAAIYVLRARLNA